jgi:hypothetical protein
MVEHPTEDAFYFSRLWARGDEPDVISTVITRRGINQTVKLRREANPELYDFLLEHGPPVPVLAAGETPAIAATVPRFR